MKYRFLSYSLTIGLAASLSHSALAQEHHHKALTDDVFTQKAAAGGLTEVDLGQIATQNGGTQDVKDFGAKMVTDHGKANDNLKAVAAKDSLTLPDKPTAEQQAMIDKLSKETGADFDKDYIHAMVHAHIGDKALFKEEIATAKNPDLKQFAQDTLRVIEDHLSMIEGMAGAGHHHKKMDMSASGGTPASAPTEMGSAAESKSGAGPGANGNPNGAPVPAATP